MPAFEKTDAKDPSLLGVVFFALLFALIGSVSGFTLLASIRPEPFSSVAEFESEMEKNSEKRLLNAYYFKGPTSSLDNWVLKREILLNSNSTTVELTDAEINAWIAKKFDFVQTPLSQKKKLKLVIIPGLPNFFINTAEGIHFSMKLEVVIQGQIIRSQILGKGHFSGENPVGFQLSELRLNEASIPFPAKLSDRLLDLLVKSLNDNEEFIALKEAWQKVNSVEVIENGIRLSLN